jgi:hypothetical protein
MFSDKVFEFASAASARQLELKKALLEARRLEWLGTVKARMEPDFEQKIAAACANHNELRDIEAPLYRFHHADGVMDGVGPWLRWTDMCTHTDFLDRLGNILCPGRFKCRMTRYDGARAEDRVIVASFWLKGFEPVKLPCLCAVAGSGFCETCGGYNQEIRCDGCELPIHGAVHLFQGERLCADCDICARRDDVELHRLNVERGYSCHCGHFVLGPAFLGVCPTHGPVRRQVLNPEDE